VKLTQSFFGGQHGVRELDQSIKQEEYPTIYMMVEGLFILPHVLNAMPGSRYHEMLWEGMTRSE